MDIKEIEQYVNQVRDVDACKILLDDRGNIQEIHIVSNMKRTPKQISRDVQSVLASKFDLEIDHKVISIAQLSNGVKDEEGFRLKLKSIESSAVNNKAEVKVVLQKDDELYEGYASGPNTAVNAIRLCAKAAIYAVEKFCGIEDAFSVEDIKTSNIAGQEVIVIAISMVENSMEKLLSGSALVERDKREAAVKAALDAINRSMKKFYSNIQAG